MIANAFRTSTLAAILAVAGLGLGLTAPAYAAATIVINNVNAAGVGFNDPTPVAPVGGNPGTTLGQQRLNVFQHVAGIWAANLTSNVTIVVNAQFTALACTATSAVLGSAGATTIHRDFTGAPIANTWYSQALANSLFGADLSANSDINADFNSNLGNAGCLTGSFFYLGLDDNEPAGTVNLAAVVLHELGHGLGFQTFTNGSTGNYIAGFPSVWDHFLLDTATGLTWNQETAAQRAASAISLTKLVWNGANVTADAPSVLGGTPELLATAPASVAGAYQVGTAGFGRALDANGVSGEVMPAGSNATDMQACTTLSAMNTLAVAGKIALVDRGTCSFAIKVKNLQNAGAIGVIVANNVAGVIGMSGSDASITIPAVMISQADGNKFKDALKFRSRTRSGVLVKMYINLSRLAGTDASGRLMMYAPNPFQSGSSVSHFDTTAFRNLLMEPSINSDLTLNVAPPFDLTLSLLKDIGWQ